MSNEIVETPLMKQYFEIKAQHPDAVLLFRCGDFYETFSTDAMKAAEVLGITLTRRANGSARSVELAGFPHHALDTYLPKLVRAGLRVAICDQLEDPKLTKKLVKRGVTELVTPGVSYSDTTLSHKENTFLAAVYFVKKQVGVSFLDISTGEFLVAEGTPEYIDKLLNSFSPKELLYDRSKRKDFEEYFGTRFFTYAMEDWAFTPDAANDRLLKQFETRTLKGFGVENLPFAVVAAGAILHYLDLTHHHQTGHISQLARIEEDRYMWLDRFTVRNLELYGSINEGARTLVDILDRTISPMGSRLLKRWVAFPLKDVKPINERLSVVEYFFKQKEEKELLTQQIALIGDLERIISKVAVGRINPREVVQLKVALNAIEPIKSTISESDNATLRRIGDQLNSCREMAHKIERELDPNPPTMINKGGVIRRGVDNQLDELRDLAHSGKEFLQKIQERESALTGIPSLKISFNNVFGYYIEVRNTHKDKVPETWIRKQTLVNAERYITQELKDYEEKILGAEEKILGIETRLFTELVLSLTEYITAIQLDSTLIAQLDCLLSMTRVAAENKYVRPDVNDSEVISIKQGRHPVIEKQLPPGESYVANDVYLDSTSQQIIIVTGPNMSGKSALLRQTALITLMAQIGSFVPVESASIGVVDKLFVRVGASDNISQGESTFMVEMNEAASILNNLSHRSLILFDELGRGTSTYDGISIAWAIVEYIHENGHHKAKTLFATHYHELNEMEKSFSRIKNYNVSVREVDKKVIFLRKLQRGGSEHSFGIHVAKMAGMPQSIVKRSEQILKQLEKDNRQSGVAGKAGEDDYEAENVGRYDEAGRTETSGNFDHGGSSDSFHPADNSDAERSSGGTHNGKSSDRSDAEGSSGVTHPGGASDSSAHRGTSDSLGHTGTAGRRGSPRSPSLSRPLGEIANSREGMQLSFFQLDDPVLEQIRDEIKGLDINSLTPLEALNKLNEIKKILN